MLPPSSRPSATALWVPDVGGDLFGAVGNLLTAAPQTTVATGILNIWMHTAIDAARNSTN